MKRRVLHGTLAELPKLARRAGPGPTVLLLGEVLRAPIANSTAAAIEKIEALLRQA